ncbi:hypothetical protein MMC07_003621 [Pseudocyphellaria aurata]|nr:hypothetical protein [Pseudocyphellaria aurata]
MPRARGSHRHGEMNGPHGCCDSVPIRCTQEHCSHVPHAELEDSHLPPKEKRLAAVASRSATRRWHSVHNDSSFVRHPGSRSSDVEKNENFQEHVVLGFQGPDCAGCVNKIAKCLDSLPAVRRMKINPILFQTEFDLDKDQTSVCDVINLVRKATGYTCERITKKWQELDAICHEDCAEVIARAFPAGVKDVVSKGKKTISIQYDAEIVGARDLLQSSFGISLGLAPPRSRCEATKQIYTTAYLTFLSSILTIPILILSWAPLPKHKVAYGAVSFTLATIIQLVVAGPLYPGAFRTLVFARTIDMGLLVVLSTTAAYTVSVISFVYQIKGVELMMGVYFETSALLVTLIMVGRLITSYACQRAMDSASIRSLQAATAVIINPLDKGKAGRKEVDIRLLHYGDIFVVEPNSVIVTDGIVVSGSSDVDESMMTGESRWLGKRPGSSVIAGSVNRSGIILVQLTRLPGSNTIDDIAGMVEEVAFTKAKIQETADRFAQYFVPAVALLSLTCFLIWITVGISVRKQSSKTAVLTAISYAISVLVVSCPCAIGLAVPMVIVIAGGIGAKQGVVVKSAGALQVARHVSHVVFDKTGTLTDNHLGVAVEEYFTEPPSLTASLILGLTSNSQHPISAAVAKHVGTMGFETAPINHLRTIVGKGIEGTFNNEVVRIGNSRWLGVENIAPVQCLLSQGLSVSCVTKGASVLAIFGLTASLRENARTIISALQTRGIAVSIVSGDDTRAVLHAAIALGVPRQNTRAKCSPADKREYVKKLMQPNPAGRNHVLFCGDGINDAAALAQADVGVFISDGGLSVAQSAADVVLMSPSLSGILTLMDLSRDSSRRIMFNFAWSAVYNVVAILFAAGAFVNQRLPPEYAGLGEAVSVLPVVAVALGMRWRKSGV